MQSIQRRFGDNCSRKHCLHLGRNPSIIKKLGRCAQRLFLCNDDEKCEALFRRELMKLNKKRWISLLVVAGLCVSLSGCIGNLYENVGTVDGREISSGLYLNLQYDAYNMGSSLVEDVEGDPLKQEVDGVPFEEWLSAETEKKLKEYVAVEQLSAENEVILSEESRSYMEQIATYWDFSSEIYTENGISYDTMMRTVANDLLKDELFLYYYGPEGELAPSDDEIETAYDEQFGRIEYISLPFTTTGDPVEEKQADVMAVAEEMQSRLEAGESMEEVAEYGVTEAYTITQRELTDTSATSAISASYLEYAPEEDDEYYPEEFRSALQEMEEGEYGIHTMDSVILVYSKVPNFEDEEMFEAERDNVVRSLYEDDFDAYMAEIYEPYPVEFALGARTYFNPGKIV